MRESALLEYINFKTEKFCKDYPYKVESKENLTEQLESIDGSGGVDYTKPRVQTSGVSDMPFALAALRINIECKLELIDSYLALYAKATADLSPEEKKVIDYFFNSELSQGQAVYELEQQGIPQSTAYMIRRNALDKIKRSLMG